MARLLSLLLDDTENLFIRSTILSAVIAGNKTIACKYLTDDLRTLPTFLRVGGGNVDECSYG